MILTVKHEECEAVPKWMSPTVQIHILGGPSLRIFTGKLL